MDNPDESNADMEMFNGKSAECFLRHVHKFTQNSSTVAHSSSLQQRNCKTYVKAYNSAIVQCRRTINNQLRCYPVT